MHLLLTGACGFAGHSLIHAFRAQGRDYQITGVDNLSRPGSEGNRAALRALGVPLIHADIRCQSDTEALPPADWVIDCAANPSVLAGAGGGVSSRQLMEHNLLGTINLLEKCRRDGSGFLLLSTSRVYSIDPLATLPVQVDGEAYIPAAGVHLPGFSECGIGETFSTTAPVSLYGATKLASEALALEYGSTFNFPVWINRCGVLAGAGQFGRPDQGIFSYWIHSHRYRRPLKYIGFDGLGHQVRDVLHPRDLAELIGQQLHAAPEASRPRLVNVSGGRTSALSLKQLTRWCDDRFGPHPVVSDPRPRAFDLPWVVLDSTFAQQHWNWTPQTPASSILEEIAEHAEAHPGWLDQSAG